MADLEACLDLINSEEFTDGVPEEHLPTVDDAVAYFTLRGLAHEDAIRAQARAGRVAAMPGCAASTRRAPRCARSGTRRSRRRTPNQAALDAVNECCAHAPRVELIPGDGGIGVGHRHADDDPTGEALARVIEPLVETIADRPRPTASGSAPTMGAAGCSRTRRAPAGAAGAT